MGEQPGWVHECRSNLIGCLCNRRKEANVHQLQGTHNDAKGWSRGWSEASLFILLSLCFSLFSFSLSTLTHPSPITLTHPSPTTSHILFFVPAFKSHYPGCPAIALARAYSSLQLCCLQLHGHCRLIVGRKLAMLFGLPPLSREMYSLPTLSHECIL